jgi:MFS transporter, FSR family, fosmidomycin resistance protein
MASAPAVDLNDPEPIAPPPPATKTAMGVLATLSVAHLLNDTIQSLLPSIYPLLKDSYSLSYRQIGAITFTYQLTASILQPVVGTLADRRPQPFSLAAGMTVTLAGLFLMSMAGGFWSLIVAAATVGLGSAIFHPEASRVAHMAAGGKHGFAQSLFQVGGNFGSSLGPLLAAGVIMRRGQASLAWFTILAMVGIVVLTRIGFWYRANLDRAKRKPKHLSGVAPLPKQKVVLAMAVLMVLVISKYVYLISLTNYYTFYLIEHFHISKESSPIYLFAFLFAIAAGTFMGGPLGDRFGRKIVIWISILGVAPFSLALPHLNLTWTVVCSMFAGTILASAFSAILVYAQELVPGKVGMIAGLFFGFAFGVAGIAAAVLGETADRYGIETVFHICAFLPLLGVLAALLPNIERHKPAN